MPNFGLSSQERFIMDRIIADEKIVVRQSDIGDFFSGSDATINSILSRLARKGWLQRLKRGIYVVVPLGSGTATPAIGSAWQIATELFFPCFISGWSSAEYWGLTDQIFNSISLVSMKAQRTKDQTYGGVRFRIRSLSLVKGFGTKKIWMNGKQVLIADPHRTIIDILDAPDFGGGGRHVLDVVKAYWKGSDQDPQKLLEYAEKLGRGTVFKRLGLTAETFGKPSKEWLTACREGCSRGVSLLDPSSPEGGPIVTRWGLRVNIPLEIK